MPYTFHPGGDFLWAMKKGIIHESVAALQLNLYGVAVDGRYGSQTKAAVWGFQEKAKITIDGICGPQTQQKIIVSGSAGAERAHDLPKNLLKSLSGSESGFALGAYSPHPDGGYDLGPYQLSFTPTDVTQQRIQRAYTVSLMAEQAAATLDAQHDTYADPVDSWYLDAIGHGDKARFAWQLATFHWNWPAGADGVARRGSLFKDAARDVVEAQWVVDATGGRLRTPREWCESYVARATVYTTWA